MISGPQTNAVVASERNVGAGHELGHDADASGPAAVRRVNGRLDGDRRAPAVALPRVQQIGRSAGAVQDAHLAVLGPALEEAEHDRSQRRDADSAGDDDHITACGRVDRPRVAERPAEAERSTGLRRANRLRDRSDGAHGEHDRPRPARRAADRDRHLADAEDIDHHELSRRDHQALARDRLQGERPCVGRVPLAACDEERPWRHRAGRAALSFGCRCHTRPGVEAASTAGAR